MEHKKAVVMQPTFLPWLGWFDLLDQADVFVVLDDVPFYKRSWQQRNRIRTPAGLEFITIPASVKGKYGQLINSVDLSFVDVDKILRTIRFNYAKASFIEDYYSEFSNALYEGVESGKLLELNMIMIKLICKFLGINKRIVSSTELDVSGKRGGYIANICSEVGASVYLSPIGSEQYLIDDHTYFDQCNIDVYIHEYDHPVYKQCFCPFISHASVFDLIVNEGENSLNVIRSGRLLSRPLGGP